MAGGWIQTTYKELLTMWVYHVFVARAETVTGMQEFCQNEIFEAQCAPDEVIRVDHAVYGRMEFSRCIERDYGYVGQCQENVLPIADAMCSGRRHCEIAIPNTQFDEKRPCPKDLKAYLEIQYACVPVFDAANQACMSSEPIRLTEPSGVIASALTRERQIGSALCPWLIEAQPGQRINLTLVDFAASKTTADICHAYTILREQRPADTLNPVKTETVCSGKERERHIYTSATNSLEIRILAKANQDRNFLLKYNVLGCGDPLVPVGGFMDRDGSQVTVGCSDRERYWRLNCVGNTWRGQRGNCSSAVGGLLGELQWGGTVLPFGVSIVVIVCIALALGLCILLIGLGILKWQRKHLPQKVPTNHGENSYQSTKYGSRPPAVRSSFDQESMYATENEYAYIADIPPPPPIVKSQNWNDRRSSAPYKADSGYSSGYNSNYNHMRSPQVRSSGHGGQYRPECMGFTAADPPKYFELDNSFRAFDNNSGYCRAMNGHAPPHNDSSDPPTPYENESPEFPRPPFAEFQATSYNPLDRHQNRNHKSV